METLFSPRGRAERLIAAGRVVLTATSLVAVWRDPSEPANYAATAYLLLAAYLVFSLGLVLVVWRSTTPPRLFGAWTHALDLAFFSAFMYFTSGPASPFFAYFVFALVGATLRWQWRGTLWTALVSLSTYFVLGWYFARVVDDPSFEPHKFIIRGAYMAVVAYLLGYLGRHEQRTRDEMSLLAAWPTRPAGSVEELHRDLLSHAARIHGARVAAAAWSPASGEPARLVVWRGGEIEARPVEGGIGALVAPGLERASLLAPAREDARGGTLLRVGGELRRWRGRPFEGPARALAEGEVTLSVPWQGELAAGRLFLVGLEAATSDDLLLAEVVAALAGARLDGQLLIERRHERAAVEERIRLARDLHDGVLQSLTGIGLRVAAARRQLALAPEEARRGLEELQRLLAVEQRDLRFFIQDLEPPPAGERDFDLAARLAELVQRVEQEWQLTIDFHSVGLDDELPDQAERDLYFIVREALVNAVRHGEARRVGVRLERSSPDRIEIRVEDDGRGFSFRGRFELGELAAMRVGPRSLRERIAARGGSLVLDSSERGARLEIGIPV